MGHGCSRPWKTQGGRDAGSWRGPELRPWPWLTLGLVSGRLFWSLAYRVSTEDGQTGRNSHSKPQHSPSGPQAPGLGTQLQSWDCLWGGGEKWQGWEHCKQLGHALG